MNYAIILAGGTGQRMHRSGMPKQFLDVYGKPIIIYTLEQFQENLQVDQIIIPCNQAWVGYMKELIEKYRLSKVKKVVVGGKDREGSVWAGLNAIEETLTDKDVVVIHDGVRPLIQQETITKNIEVAKARGNAMTVRANVETVVVTKKETAQWEDFKDRRNTYTLTAPQSFRGRELVATLRKAPELIDDADVPLLDASLVYAKLGKEVFLVVEEGHNLKITTPEDYYYLKAYLELQESKNILGV